MNPSDEYTGVRMHRPDEKDFDGAAIVRPSTKVITFTPEGGYGEAVTSDRELQRRRTEEASKKPLKKKSAAKSATKKKAPAKKAPAKKPAVKK